MNVDQLIRTTLRRKLACLVVVLCAVGAGVFGMMSSTASYESSAVAVVYPPGAGALDATLNPFVNLNDNMSQLAAVTATLLQSPEAVSLVEQSGASPEYTVTSTLGDTASALRLSPQLMITTSGPTPEAAQAGAQALLDYSTVALAQLQVDTGVLPDTEASIAAAVRPDPGTVVPTSPLKAAGSYGLAVLVVGLLAVIGIGTILDRRSANTTAARHTATSPDALTTSGAGATSGVAAVATSEAAAVATSHPQRRTRAQRRASHEPPRVAPVAAAPNPTSPERVGATAESATRRTPAAFAATAQAGTTPEAVTSTPNDDVSSSPAPEDRAPEDRAPEDRAPEDRAPEDDAATRWITPETRPTNVVALGDQVSRRAAESLRPPQRLFSTRNPAPPASAAYEAFDPFNVPTLRDPREVTSSDSAKNDDAGDSERDAASSTSEATPVRRIDQDLDDYYGVEDRAHFPAWQNGVDYPRSSIGGGGSRR